MAVTEYIRNADRAVLNTVFKNTIRRVNKCLVTGGGQFEHCLLLLEKTNNMHFCTNPSFYVLAPTCFGSSLPSSGSFLDLRGLLEVQIELVVYHIMCGYVARVPECRGFVCCIFQLSWEAQQTEPRHSGTQFK
jgi:hypothetical protein